MKINNFLRWFACFILKMTSERADEIIFHLPKECDGKTLILGTFSYAKLRQIQSSNEDKPVLTYLVHENDVPKMVQAIIDLHASPSFHRPHPCWVDKIVINSLAPTGPYWWSTPELQDESGKFNKNGALVYEWREHCVVFDSKKGINLLKIPCGAYS